MIVYPPEMLPSPDEDSEADVIVDGVVIYSTDGEVVYRRKKKEVLKMMGVG